MAIYLAPFDRDRDFVALRDFQCRGEPVLKDSPFDKSRVSLRLLRILYDTRSIGYAVPVPEFSPTERRHMKPYNPAMDPDANGTIGGMAPIPTDDDFPPLPWDDDIRKAISDGHTKKQLCAELDRLNVEYDDHVNKAALIAEIEKARNGALNG